jgi:transcriptional regulator with XRE-family HTH domain
MGKIHSAIVAIVKYKKDLRQLTQVELALRVGCSQSMISDLLSGEKRLSETWIEKLCDALGIKFADLENWNPELAKIRFQPAPGAAAGGFMRKGNQKYHDMLDRILDAPKKKWAKGIIANLEAMSLAASGPESKHGPFDIKTIDPEDPVPPTGAVGLTPKKKRSGEK